jgi:hypothetical protein
MEIVTLCLVRDGYILSFFFWMDMVSTFSMVLEVPWVVKDMLGLDILSGSANIVK